MSQNTQNTSEQYIDVEIGGVLIPRMKIMTSQYKGRCLRTGKWFDPGTLIAFKHRDHLTDIQIKALFGDGKAYNATVIVDSPAPAPSVPTPKRDWVPSVYQNNIRNQLHNTQAHLFIEALAGAGKTQTLVWLVQDGMLIGLFRGKRIVYMAFNKSIQEELSQKLQGTGCPAMTTHSFGFQLLKRQFKELEKAGSSAVKNSKTGEIFHQLLSMMLYGDVSSTSLKKTKKSDNYKCRKAVLSLVGFIKNWAIIPELTNDGYVFSGEQKTRVKGFVEEYEINIPKDFEADQVVDYACAVVSSSIPMSGETLTRVSYDDMLYLPLALNLTFPKYDLVLTDESQDFNEAQEQFLFRLVNKGARCIVVGDENQSMYRFRGSDSKAFKKIKSMLEQTALGVITCELPVNYRSDEVIIEHARQWVPNLQGRGKALGQQRGELSFDTTYSQALQWVNNDGVEEFAFLCRINVPLIVTAYQLIAQGKRVCIIGRQAIASPMISIIEDLCGLPDRQGNVPEYYTDRITDRRNNDGHIVEEGLLTRLANYYRSQSAKFMEEGFDQALEDLTNNCDCIEIIAGRVKEDSVKAVVEEIESLFVEKADDKSTINLSTVHRAKGLEWDNVLILCPYLMPHPNVRVYEDDGETFTEEYIQELNIEYVAATRAKHKLHYICNWPFGRGKGNRLTPQVAEPEPVAKPIVSEPLPEPVVTEPKPVIHTFIDDGEPF